MCVYEYMDACVRIHGRMRALRCGRRFLRQLCPLGLLTQYRQAHTTYVGVNAGMNSLLRPSLYDAHHPIVNLSQLSALSRSSIILLPDNVLLHFGCFR
jgi:hypothetical protein